MSGKHGALLPAVDVAKMLTRQIDAIVGLIEQVIFRACAVRPMNPRPNAEWHVLPGHGHRMYKLSAMAGMKLIHDTARAIKLSGKWQCAEVLRFVADVVTPEQDPVRGLEV